MNEYHKIASIYKRDTRGAMIIGLYSTPEIEYLANLEWQYTEKVDGTNIRIMWTGAEIVFGGKTDNAQIPATLVKVLQDKFLSQSARFAEVFGLGPACLYGEGYGAKIQSGGLYRPDQSFVMFDVKCGSWWLERKDVEDVAAKFGLDVVPTMGSGTLETMVAEVRRGPDSAWGKFKAEGIVARPAVALFNRRGERIITKLKHKDFARVTVADDVLGGR